MLSETHLRFSALHISFQTPTRKYLNRHKLVLLPQGESVLVLDNWMHLPSDHLLFLKFPHRITMKKQQWLPMEFCAKGQGRIFSVHGSRSFQKHCHLLKEYSPLFSSRRQKETNKQTKTHQSKWRKVSPSDWI